MIDNATHIINGKVQPNLDDVTVPNLLSLINLQEVLDNLNSTLEKKGCNIEIYKSFYKFSNDVWPLVPNSPIKKPEF